jgi:hypothetical protein
MIGPRHTTIDSDARAAALQNSENARDAIEALKIRPPMTQLNVARYTATGSTSTRIPIGAAQRPWAEQLARIALVFGEDQPVVCSPVLNFVWDATTGSIDVFEPSGLTADVAYTMNFCVWEAAQ